MIFRYLYLATLSEYCLPYVKVGGCFIPYKSGEIDEELNNSKKAVQILGGKIEEVVKFQLPDLLLHGKHTDHIVHGNLLSSKSPLLFRVLFLYF